MLVLTIPPLGLLPIFPAFWVFDRLDNWMGIAESQHVYYLAAIPLFAWPTAFVLVLVTVAFIVVFRWVVLPRVTRGDLFGLVLVLSAQMGGRARDGSDAGDAVVAVRHALHAHLVSLMGAKIGKDSEISDQSLRPLRSRRHRREMLHRRRGGASATRTFGAAGCI